MAWAGDFRKNFMPEFHIKTIELPLPPVQYTERYGVEIESVRQQDLLTMINELYVQSVASHGLARQMGIAPLDNIVSFSPSFVLTGAPSAEQIKLFNADHTQTVAEYAVATQRALETVPIIESWEGLVYLPGLLEEYEVSATFSDTPFHEACGDWAGKPRQYWARESFARRLVAMGSLLNTQGLELHFEDAFRPVGVQEGLFKRRIDWTRADHPEWTDAQVIQEAMSKTAVKPRLASHKGGAAVDARMRDMNSKNILDFGHNYPDGGALVFPQTTFITRDQWLNRQQFQVAAGLSGLTLYVGEDWHVSYGDNLASLDSNGQVQPGYTAQYGPIKDFDRQTGQISRYYKDDEIDRTFDF